MSEAFNPLATPNAQQWLKVGVDEKQNTAFGVDYTTLLAQSGEDKARAFDTLAQNLKDADFNFDILQFNFQNDKAAAFDALKEQNTYFSALPQQNENERAQRQLADEKVRADIAILNDENASADDKNNAREGYYDYLLKFGGGDKEQKKEFKNNVLRPFLEQQKSALADEMSDTNAEKIAQIDKKLNDLRDKDKKLYEIDESKLDLSDYEIAQKFGLAGESSFIDKGKSVINTLFNFFDPYLDSTIMDADKIKNAEQAKVIANARTKISEALAQGKEPQRSDFDLQEQYQLYLSGYAGSDLGEKYADVANLTMKDKKIVDDFIQKGIDNYKKELEIANTDYDKLTDEQRQWLYDKSGVFNRGWDRVFKDDDEETLQQSYNIIKGGALMKIASERAQSVQNFAKTHNLAWLGTNYVFGSDKRFDKEYQNYLDDVEGIALDLQFDGIDKSGQYFYKTDENGNTLWFKLDDGFFNNLGNMFKDNAYSILGGLGGVVGGVWAARKGKAANATRGIVGGLGETGGAIVGSFVGSTAGGAADYINYALSNGKDIDFSQMITHATQEGLFSLVADGVAVGLSKLANTKGAKALFAPVTKAAHGVDTLIRKSPILGTIYSMPRNFFKGQNIEAAEELVLRYYTPEQRADIESALKELGGGLNIGTSNNLLSKNSQFVADKLAQKYGSESSIAKTAQGFADAINMKGFKERQAQLLQFVISDESGKNLGYVLEIAGKSPEVAKNLENIVRYSGLQLENALKKLDLPENQFKAVFKEFEKGTEQSFDEAMKLIGEQIFDGKVYKTKIDKAPFDDFLKAMGDEKIYMGDAEKRFVKEIIEPLFDENGVTFSQLNNIRKELNSKFKDIQSPTFKDYLRGQVGKKLREAVDRGINDIFRQNPRAYAKVKELYDTALKEYSTMKDIQTIIKKHNFHKEETDFAKDLNKLLKFIIEGKGNEKVPNLERILGQLTPQNRAVAEVNILKQMLENTKITLKQQFGRGQTRTFFTWDFIDNLDALAKRGNVFQSKAAQDFIKIVKDWHKLNKNHADILFSLKPADVKGVRQGIATRIQGRLEQMRTNLLMSNMFRLLDKIPFANALWDKTQAGALRFHIKNALSNSISIDDFRLKLLNKVETGNFDNNTKKIIREIIGEADNAEQTLAKMDEMENEILSLSDDELAKREIMSNLEKSQQFGRDMFILGEENLSGDIVKWTLENNKRVAINKLNPQKAQELGFKYPNDVRRTIGADEIRHTLNNHGANSNNVKKSGQIPVDETDIANYQKVSDNADETLKGFDNDGHLVEVSFKQVNGYYVVVEQVRNKNNEFSFKTMYKGRGNFKDSKIYTKTAEKAQTLSQGYEPSANSLALSAEKDILPQNTAQSQATPKAPAQNTQAKSKFELDEWNGKVDETNHTEFIDDAVETIQRRELFETPIFDPTKNAVKTKSEALQRLDELESANAYPKEAIESVRQKLVSDDENLSQSIRAHKEQRLAENAQIEAQKAEITAQQKAEYPNGVYHYETPNESVSIRLSDDGAEVITHNKDFDSKGTMTTQREHAVNLIKVGENTKNASWTQRPQKAQQQTQAAQKSLLNEINTQKAVLATNKKILENLNKQAKMTYLDPYAFRVEKAQLELDIAQGQKKINELENALKNADDELFLRETIKKIENGAQKGTEMALIGRENLNAPVLEYLQKNDKKAAIEIYQNDNIKKALEFKHDDVRRTIQGSEINHALNRHGEKSELAKNGQPAITLDDIANYADLADSANAVLFGTTSKNLPAVISFKQVNGYYVVVEEVRKGQNELAFQTMYKGKGNFKDSEAFKKATSPDKAAFQGYKPHAHTPKADSGDNFSTNTAQSQAEPKAPQKSLLDLAREETQRLKQAQIDKELAQKEAEIARLKEMKAQKEQIIAQKESKAGLSANEAQSLQIGNAIPTKLLKPTKIIVGDTAQPFEAEFVIAKKSDIKPNFERTGTQGRSEKQSKVIDSIQSDFKPHLIFEQSGGFEGLPIITKDGQVIAGNHRAEAINALSGEQLARYKQAAKEKFSVDLADDEVIVRLVNDENEKDLINLAFMSNVGRESNLGEKALSNLAKFESQMPNLPNHIDAQSVDELQNIIAKTLDKQGGGLNTFDTNLALFSKLAKNSNNNDILDALNKIQNLSAEEKSKILKMFVDNAGSFFNLAKDADLKNLDLRPYLNDSLVVAANSYATRAEDFARLLGDIEHILSLSEAGLKETLALDKNLFENLKSKALGLSLARFARLENPSSQLFDFLKNAKANLEELNSANLFDSTGKTLDELDIYDFLKHSIAQGRENDDALKIIGKLDELREVEKRALKNGDEAGDIIFKDNKGKKHILGTQTQELWKNTFNLKNIDDEVVIDLPKELKETLGKDIKLKVGSLYKLVAQGREEFIPQIKEVLQSPELALKDSENGFLFVKHLKDDDYFVNVSVDKGEYLISISNGIKSLNNLKNKLDNGANILYQSPNANSNLQTLLQASLYSANKIDDKIIPKPPTKSQMSYDDYFKAKNELEAQAKLELKTLKNEMEQSTPEKVVKKELEAIRDELKTLDDKTGQNYAKFFIKNPKKTQAFSFSSEEKAKSSLEWANKFIDEYTKAGDKEGIEYVSRLRDIIKKHIDNIDNANALQTELKNNYAMKEKTILQEYNKRLQALQEQLANTTQITNDKARANATGLKRFAKMFDTNIDKEIIERDFEDNLTPQIYKRELQRIRNLRQEIENALNIKPLQEFGTNYAEFYKDGAGAVKKLLAEAKAASEAGENFNGQVAGAFWRKELGDIDLIWGDSEKGLKHILDKHGKDFKNLGEELSEIVEKGEVIDDKGIKTILFKKDNEIYRVGLSKGFKGNGDNLWIITSYKVDKSPRSDFLPSSEVIKGDGTNLHPSDLTNEIIPKTTNKSQIDERTNPNILMANQHLGAGILGGTINGIETDENGNVIGFSPEKFVAGFLGGAGASKATQFALKNPKIRAKADKFLKESGEFIVRELRDENLSAQARQGLETLFGKALVRAMDSRAFIIAGENAIGANKAKLARAKTLQKAGKSDDEIWLKTGWYEDKDGKWKFEINPQGGELKKDFRKLGDEVFLSEILKDNKLFKAYPSLKTTFIEFKDYDFGADASFRMARSDGEMRYIVELEYKRLYNEALDEFQLDDMVSEIAIQDDGIGVITLNSISDYEMLKYHLYHEIQHAVQNIENFAKGGNVETAFNNATKNEQKSILKTAKKLNIDPDYLAYKRLHGEVEARNVEQRMANTKEAPELVKTHPYKTQDTAKKDTIIKFDEPYFDDEYKQSIKNLDTMSSENLTKLGKMSGKKQGEKMLNNDLQKLFTSEKRLDYDKIKNYAKPNSMPKPNFKNYNEFRALFDNVKENIGFVNTPYAPVKVKIYKAYEHFTKNTNNKNRENIKGGFFSTLTDPLFIVKNERAGQNEPSVYFYKPFLSKDKSGKESVMNIFSIAVDYNGNLDFKTYYHDDKSNRLKSVMNSVLQGNGEVVYIKSPNG